MMKNSDLLYLVVNAAFYAMAIVVVWNSLAPSDYRMLTEIGRKIWAMAGLGLYVVILLERRRRDNEKS